MNNTERKKLLPRGAARRIARRLKVGPQWVSQVLHTEDTGQRSPRVERAIAREIVKAHPHVNADEVFPPRGCTPLAQAS